MRKYEIKTQLIKTDDELIILESIPESLDALLKEYIDDYFDFVNSKD